MRTEDRRPKTENRRPKTEDRRPKTEGRRPKAETRAVSWTAEQDEIGTDVMEPLGELG